MRATSERPTSDTTQKLALSDASQTGTMSDDRLEAAREELLPNAALIDEDHDEHELDTLREPPIRTWSDWLHYMRRPWLCGASRVRSA